VDDTEGFHHDHGVPVVRRMLLDRGNLMNVTIVAVDDQIKSVQGELLEIIYVLGHVVYVEDNTHLEGTCEKGERLDSKLVPQRLSNRPPKFTLQQG
jgi:hypothetical protein